MNDGKKFQTEKNMDRRIKNNKSNTSNHDYDKLYESLTLFSQPLPTMFALFYKFSITIWAFHEIRPLFCTWPMH